MKTQSKVIIIALAIVAQGLSGCSVTASAAKKFKEFEALGITEATVTGKFSNTDYQVETKDGTRKAVFKHSNAWLPKVYIVRETKD